MITILKKIFGIENPTDYADLVKKGAIVLDVRTKGEYAGGHIKGSLNIPLDQLMDKLAFIKGKQKPIITCCASGMRSASAKRILKSSGLTEVFNGGGWSSLERKIK